MRKTAISPKKAKTIPKSLRVFAWNLGDPLSAFGRKMVALNVIERGRAWHWTKLPKGWFDLEFCLRHGQKRTKQTLRELFRTQT